ncbi:MAG: DEAD/DEAH box helicase [Bacteroidetes bacterium]|nr:DEAD/DEAH box helicase [Bacteroidota bacterium]
MFKERLNKKLAAELEINGISEPTPLQLKCIPKINGGFDIVASAPPQSGKTTTIVLGAIQKLGGGDEGPPRALILVGTMEKVLEMKGLFHILAKDSGLRIKCAYEEGKIDIQSEEIYVGADIVIGTPQRILEIYFSKNLNLNKIKFFAIDDAELMIKHRFQGPVDRIGLSLPKCQHVVFTNMYDDKIQRLISKFIVAPQIIEIPAQN